MSEGIIQHTEEMEIESLRAENARLKKRNAVLEKEKHHAVANHNDLPGEWRVLNETLKDRDATIAGMRDALIVTKEDSSCRAVHGAKCNCLACVVLARTPQDHRRRIEAEGMREALDHIWNTEDFKRVSEAAARHERGENMEDA